MRKKAKIRALLSGKSPHSPHKFNSILNAFPACLDALEVVGARRFEGKRTRRGMEDNKHR
jgi:hypothetical protein